jgi:SAM-dependent methyltransferase
MTEVFEADWLAEREPFDAAACSLALAERFAAALPARPRVLDLGAGTGSLFRWLAPIIGRAQAWTLADADADLLEAAFIDCADWGAAHGYAATFPGGAHNRALLLHTPRGAWRVEALRVDLAHAPAALPLDRVDAVVCSALLDLVSRGWLERFCAALRVPLLACLTVDGRDSFFPRDPADRIVLGGFRRDQSRDKGLGPALGPHAPRVLHDLLAGRGFGVASEASDWRIPRDAAPMLRRLVQTHAAVAALRRPACRAAIDVWASTRMRQIETRRLAMRIGHRDSLAVPTSDD